MTNMESLLTDILTDLRDPDYRGPMQHLRAWPDIDRIHNRAAAEIERLHARVAALEEESTKGAFY